MKQNAQTHGTHRWHQGYDIEEVMQESGLVRQVVALDCLREFQRDEPAFDNTAREHAETIIHQFFTDMAVESARQFAGEKEKALSWLR